MSDNPGGMAMSGRGGAGGQEADVDALLTRREELMASYPSDGWDGAAFAIAQHHAKVVDLERALDAKYPGWRAASSPHREFEESMEDLDEIADSDPGGSP